MTLGIRLNPRESGQGRRAQLCLPAMLLQVPVTHVPWPVQTYTVQGLHFHTSRNELPPGAISQIFLKSPATTDLSYMFVLAWNAMGLMVLKGRHPAPHDRERDP